METKLQMKKKKTKITRIETKRTNQRLVSVFYSREKKIEREKQVLEREIRTGGCQSSTAGLVEVVVVSGIFQLLAETGDLRLESLLFHQLVGAISGRVTGPTAAAAAARLLR